MKKYRSYTGVYPKILYSCKIFKVMRNTLLLILITALQVSAIDTYSQNTKLSLNLNNVTVANVLEEIENKSEFYFLFNAKLIDVKREVSISMEDTKISDILTSLFSGTEVNYLVYDRQIILTSGKGTTLLATIEQQLKITGTVTDKNGAPLPGVNVVATGTTSGTLTDIEGKYNIQIPQGSKSLTFSFIGMESQEINIGASTQINAIMSESAIGLDEVVVVGYGSIKKTDLTGSISTVKSAEIGQLATQRTDQALQGRTTGVQIVNSDGAPGNNTVIRIRGFNSVTGASEPLVIVDGLQGVSLNSINPQDIASVEILKDASATAIYGSRGSNGVILITTKIGAKGKPVIDVDVNTSISQLSKKLPQMGAADYAKLTNTWRMLQTGSGNVPTPYFTDAEITSFEKNGGTDWQDELFRIAPVQNANIAVSGATEKLKYMVSLGYIDQKGIMLNTSYDRLSLRTNLAADITKWVDFGINYSYTREHNASHSSYTSYSVMGVNRWSPTVPIYDENGVYSVHPSGYGGSSMGNPVAEAVEPIYFNPTYNNNVNIFLNFKPVEGLSLKIMGGALITGYYNNIFYNTKTQSGLTNNGYGNVTQYLQESFQNTNILTYDTVIGEHHLKLTGVVEQNTMDYRYNSLTGMNFLVEQLNFDNMSGAQSISTGSAHSKRALLSYLGRINYSLMDKYLVTLSYRADGSSVFGKDNKYGYFPSGSLAWRISQEEFLKNSIVISELKLRASYGATGNQGISPYQSFASLGTGSSYRYPLLGGLSTNIGYGVSGVSNTSLKWETTTQTDIGVDVSLFKGRLTSTIDVYKKLTKDLLMYKSLPQYFGIQSMLDNVGSIENKGLEIQIGGNPLIGRFKWNTSFNISFNRNKVLDLGETTRLNVSVSQGQLGFVDDFMYLEVGQPVGQMSGWKFLGLWGAGEDAEARSYGQLPGDLKFADINGVDENGKIVPVPDGVVNWYDRIPVLHAQPKFTYGWSNQFSYKQFDLSL
jgi:TonB-linked SusC/RagA family outer membrane protein